MANTNSALVSKGELQFLVTFMAGMAMFQFSGWAPGLLPADIFHNRLGALVMFALAVALFALGFVILNWLLLGRSRRALRAAFMAGLTVALLAVLAPYGLGPVIS